MQNTPIELIHQLYGAVIDLVSLMNQPHRDALMIEEARINLDRALFPLLVGIGRCGPIGVGELANRVGRDYTTVSRQVAKLERLGLIERRSAPQDKRVREATLSAAGRAMTERIDQARDRVLTRLLADWNTADIALLATLLGRLTARVGESDAAAPGAESDWERDSEGPAQAGE